MSELPPGFRRYEQNERGELLSRHTLSLPGVQLVAQESRFPGRQLEVGQLADCHAIIVCSRRGRVGEVSYGFDGEPYSPWRRKPPAFARLIPSGCAARLRFRDTAETRFLALLVDDQRFEALRAGASGDWWRPRARSMQLERDPFLLDSATAIRRVLSGDGVARELVADSLVTDLLAHLVGQRGVAREGPPEEPDDRLATAVRFVEDHLGEALSLASIASQVGWSPYHFARRFRGRFGTSVHRFVVGRRIQRARELLAQGESTIQEIALACGFASHSHFSDAFRRSVGCTPTSYRREARALAGRSRSAARPDRARSGAR